MLFRWLDRLRRKRQELDAPQWDQIYTNVFKSDSGMLVLQDLLDNFGMFRAAVPGTDQPEYSAWYFEGRRSVVLHILDKLTVRNIDELQEVAET